MKCNICKSEKKYIFNAKILKKYNASYYYCDNCDFIQIDNPFWLDEAYNESINISDTGILTRNIYFAQALSLIIYFLFNKKGKYLDFAGGYGIFTRMMRDIGFDFYWSDRYSENLIARGFEYNNKDEIELICAIEVFEHFVDPIVEIENILQISKNIFFSTELYKGEPPQINDWSYYSTHHGQHIAFYSLKTLKFIAKKYNLNLYSDGKKTHLFTEKKISNSGFNIIMKLRYLGIFNVIKIFLRSKTLSDCHKLQ